MKKLSLLIIILVAGCCSGPRYPKGIVLEVQKNSARMQAYMKRKTTGEQDRKMLKANAAAWKKLEGVVNGK